MSSETLDDTKDESSNASPNDPERCRSNSQIVAAWNGDNDPENPLNWSKARKWRVTGFSCFMCFMVGINALSITSAAMEINDRFGISDASFPNSYWTVTAWNLGAAIFPPILIPILEDFSIRIGYLVAYGLFIAFVIPQAVAPNFATLIVTRFFAGGFASIVQNAVEAVIGDLWQGEEVSLPVTVFMFAYLAGFTMGPVFGAGIVRHLYWRWIFYIQLILYCALLPVAILMIKETRGKIKLKRRARALSKKTGKPVKVEDDAPTSFARLMYDSTVRPLYLFFTEPVVFFFTIWASVAISTIFIATQSTLQVYGALYNFTEVEVGYVSAAQVVGEIVGFFICVWQNRIYANSSKKNKVNPGEYIPESRLQLSIPTSFLGLAGGLFIYGWTSYRQFPWIAPTIGLGLSGVGITVVVQSAGAYITDAYGIWAGSAIAAFACFENLCSAFLPLTAMAMYTNLGYHWASSLIGFILLALSFAPLVLYLKGPTIRRRSKWMGSI